MITFARTALLAALAIAAVGFSSGCASVIDEDKAQAFVTRSFEGAPVELRDASCPKDVDVERGKTFTCRVTWKDGDTGTVTMHMTSDDGDVKFAQKDVRVDD